MQLNNVDDIIRCVTLGQEKANENASLYNRKRMYRPIRMLCFKVDPELDVNSTKESRRGFPKIPVRKIENIRSYYNLHNDESGNLKTSLYANSGESYELNLQGSFSQEQPSFSYRGEQIFRSKHLNIQNNLGNKEKFLKRIAKKKTPFALISSQNSNQDNNNNSQSLHTNNLDSQAIINNDIPVPNSCLNNCNECNSNCEYTIQNLEEKDKKKQIKQQFIIKELQNHGHPGSLKIKTNNKKTYPTGFRFRTTEESREELKLHYLKYHFNRINRNHANTSSALS